MIQDIQYEALYRMCDIVQFIYRGEYDFYDSQAENRIEVITVKKSGSNNARTVELKIIPQIPIICSPDDEIQENTIASRK